MGDRRRASDIFCMEKADLKLETIAVEFTTSGAWDRYLHFDMCRAGILLKTQEVLINLDSFVSSSSALATGVKLGSSLGQICDSATLFEIAAEIPCPGDLLVYRAVS
jgi:hypothetical protein